MDQGICARVQGKVARLLALAEDPKVRHAAARMVKIPNLELAQLVTPERVVEKRRQDRAIALVLEALARRRGKELSCLVVPKRRRFALTAFRPRPLDPFDRVMGDGVLLAEVFEKGGERRQAMPDGRAA
jgi:hypothetical protein